MKRTIAMLLLPGLMIANSVQAQQKKKQDRPERQAPFQQFFTLRGIEFNEEQQAKVEELRRKYTPKLTELQRKQNGVYTAEQRRARREALQTARDAGKNRQELQQALAKAIKLTDEQQKELAANRKALQELVADIQKDLQALLTPQQRRRLQQQTNRNRRSAVTPTHRDVKYGKYDRNVMDVWLAKSEKPTPVLVSIHGGGFRGGNKSVDRNLLRQCLDSGISVVAITYRLSGEAIAPTQHYDSARAIQFIRYNAEKWNLDPKRIASTGGSAGAGISLWLGFHDDLADPDNEDPVLRQSTRLTCMSVYNGQSSYDPRFIRELFPGKDTYKHSALAQLYDVDLDNLDNLPKEKYKLFEQVSAINHLSKDDVPAQLSYGVNFDTPITSQGIGIHHPKFGQVLKEKMDKLGIECRVHTNSRRGSEEWVRQTLDFVKKHFKMEQDS